MIHNKFSSPAVKLLIFDEQCEILHHTKWRPFAERFTLCFSTSLTKGVAMLWSSGRAHRHCIVKFGSKNSLFFLVHWSQHSNCMRRARSFWGIWLGSFMISSSKYFRLQSDDYMIGANLFTQRHCDHDVIMTFRHSNEPVLLWLLTTFLFVFFHEYRCTRTHYYKVLGGYFHKHCPTFCNIITKTLWANRSSFYWFSKMHTHWNLLLFLCYHRNPFEV